jgi:hypothetical protein
MNATILPSVGPYTFVSADVTRGRYRLVVYGAYNAFGLIGSEKNGIAVLDDEDRCVVADELFIADSGYFGPSKAQVEGLRRLLTCSPKDFCKIVNSSGRNRHDITPDTVAPAKPAFELV